LPFLTFAAALSLLLTLTRQAHRAAAHRDPLCFLRGRGSPAHLVAGLPAPPPRFLFFDPDKRSNVWLCVRAGAQTTSLGEKHTPAKTTTQPNKNNDNNDDSRTLRERNE
jgi:hypothetical protein